MVLYCDGNYVTNSAYPDTDFMGDADFVVADGSDLAQKIIRLYPNFDIVTDDEGGIAGITESSVSAESIIPDKKEELSKVCEAAIISGVDVGDKHYSMTIEDQANILAWMAVAQTGKAVPYHSDGNPCEVYSADDFLAVANAAVAYKTHHTTYCNLLMRQVEEMTDAEEVKAVEYGVTQLNEKYQAQYNVIMASLVGDDDE